MRIVQSAVCLIIGVLGAAAFGAPGSAVRLNSLGFLPDGPKVASVTGDASGFVVRETSSGRDVFAGALSAPRFQADVNETVRVADFSAFTLPGEYVLETSEGARSEPFSIAAAVYQPAFITVTRGFYLWRCGTAVSGTHRSRLFAHAACHLEDGFLDYQGKPGERRDGTGGWHDAGDYGKYTVNAGITLGVMFMAWDHFPESLRALDLGLPRTAPGYPDFLQELKWETDWLLKMQYPDGSGRVAHKLTAKVFEPFCLPEDDRQKRYFTDWSTEAVASFVAMMAQASRHFAPYDPVYAARLLEAARVSYRFLRDTPPRRFEQGEFKTGAYQSDDADDRLWAAAELWESTGEDGFRKDFEAHVDVAGATVEADWDWRDVSNLGVFQYVLSKRAGRNPDVVARLQRSIVAVADEIAAQAERDVYARPLVRYYWGANGTVARQVVNLQVADRIAPNPKYRAAALAAVDHLLGRNVYGRSYLTGVGHDPARFPHDRRSGADREPEPWPGYLVGGGHTATGWIDREEDYRTNEIAINWQGALVYALAGFLPVAAPQ
jgi:endoglucanase